MRQSPTERAEQISRVLVRVLVLNLAVAIAKLVYGYWTGAVSIFSDGLHSATDAASNVVALVGIRTAQRPPDASHPYGHRKFETLASAAILFFLLLVLIEVIEAAAGRLRVGGAPHITGLSYGIMGATLAINLLVVRYESRAARRLGSEVLIADSYHTRSDVLTSVAVIAALAGVQLGWPMLDPVVALLIAVFIGRACYEIAKETSGILADHVVLDRDEVRRVVTSVPEAVGCHEIRTRGSADHAFLDLHVWFPPRMPLEEAHRLSHEVKDRLMTAFPSLADVIIHIEPPPREVGSEKPEVGS